MQARETDSVAFALWPGIGQSSFKPFACHPDRLYAQTCRRRRLGQLLVPRQLQRAKNGMVLASYQPDFIDVAGAESENIFDELAAKVIVTWMGLSFGEAVSADANIILRQYAHATCAEIGVLRCDVLRQNNNFSVWTMFADRSARAEHERSPHAAQLRLLLARKEGLSDNAVELVRLANEARLQRPFWPMARNAWRETFSRKSASVEDVDGVASDPFRQSLDALVQNVGLEDAVVLVARASALDDEYALDAKQVCMRYASDMMGDSSRGDGIVRVGVLEDVGHSRAITVLQVHSGSDESKALFDEMLAAELLDESGWTVDVYVSVFPDRSGWEIADMNDYSWNTAGYEMQDQQQKRGEDGSLGERMSIGEAYEIFEAERAMLRGESATSPQVNEQASVAAGICGDGVVDLKPRTSQRLLSPADRAEKELISVTSDDGPNGSSANPAKESMPAPSHEVRVLHGNGAFSNLERRMRSLCNKKGDEIMRVFVISGWNEARLQPFVMEMDVGMDAGRIDLCVGLNVFGASATLGKVAAGVASARRHRADIVVAFGGGAVIDAAKAVSALLRLSPNSVIAKLMSIRAAAESGKLSCEVPIGLPAVPSVLIAGTIGSGAEISERTVLTSNSGSSGFEQRIFVAFQNDDPFRCLSVADPRLVIPRRLNGHDASLGGLQALCFAIDVLLCPGASGQAIDLAEQAIFIGRDAILAARREPESSDGPARDYLVDCAILAALAREACGGYGLGTLISLSLLNVATPTILSMDAPLRNVLPRVVASIVQEYAHSGIDAAEDVSQRAASIVLGRADASSADLVSFILGLGEDIGVRLLRDVGIDDSCANQAAKILLNSEILAPLLDHRLHNMETLERIIVSASQQEFEL